MELDLAGQTCRSGTYLHGTNDKQCKISKLNEITSLKVADVYTLPLAAPEAIPITDKPKASWYG
jgi:hypothetical protein